MNKNNYFALTKEQQALVLNQASAKIGLPPQAVEKDIFQKIWERSTSWCLALVLALN